MATVNFDHAWKGNKRNLHQNNNKKFYFKKKKQKLELVFDEKAREEFLTGFHKRKVQRKKKAQEVLEQELKAERQRIKREAKNALKKLVESQRDIPELGELQEDTNVIEMGTHEVHITELDPDKIARQNNWIGPNKVKLEVPELKEESESEDEIEGMETKVKIEKKEKTKQIQLSTAKEVKKFVKKVATKNVQKSKAFQKKKDLEARRNKKKKLREEKNKEKMLKKRTKRNR